MKSLTMLSTLLLLLLSVTATQAAKDHWIIKTDGSRIEGVGIEADSQGNLKIKLEADRDIATTVKWGEYRSVRTPEPREVKAIASFFARNEHAKVISAVGQVFDRFKFLGWADELKYMEGMSHLAGQQFEKALETFTTGAKFTMDPDEKSKLNRGMIEAHIALDQFDKAAGLLDQLSVKDPDTAAYRFSIKGRLLEQQGKKRDAVLNHLKVIMLYPDAGEVRKDAYQHVIRLLKSMNDNRYMDFERDYKQQYG